MSDTFTEMLDEYFTLVYDFATRPKVTAWDHIEPVGKIEKQRDRLIAFVKTLQDNEIIPYTPRVDAGREPAIHSKVLCICPLCHDDKDRHGPNKNTAYHTQAYDNPNYGCSCRYCLDDKQEQVNKTP